MKEELEGKTHELFGSTVEPPFQGVHYHRAAGGDLIERYRDAGALLGMIVLGILGPLVVIEGKLESPADSVTSLPL